MRGRAGRAEAHLSVEVVEALEHLAGEAPDHALLKAPKLPNLQARATPVTRTGGRNGLAERTGRGDGLGPKVLLQKQDCTSY